MAIPLRLMETDEWGDPLDLGVQLARGGLWHGHCPLGLPYFGPVPKDVDRCLNAKPLLPSSYQRYCQGFFKVRGARHVPIGSCTADSRESFEAEFLPLPPADWPEVDEANPEKTYRCLRCCRIRGHYVRGFRVPHYCSCVWCQHHPIPLIKHSYKLEGLMTGQRQDRFETLRSARAPAHAQDAPGQSPPVLPGTEPVPVQYPHRAQKYARKAARLPGPDGVPGTKHVPKLEVDPRTTRYATPLADDLARGQWAAAAHEVLLGPNGVPGLELMVD